MKTTKKRKKTIQNNHTKPCMINSDALPAKTDKFVLFSFSDNHLNRFTVPASKPVVFGDINEKFFATLRLSNRFPFIHLKLGD